jgi:hypothetical protein
VTIEEVLSATRFTDNARQAATYRMGRVLLAGANDLVGRGTPEIVLAGGRRLAELLHDGRGVLLGDFAVEDDRLHVAKTEGAAMLIRPDGIVAWVEGDGELDSALRRWFGGVRVG